MSKDRVIAGRYRIKQRLGRGNFGVVWEADEMLGGAPIGAVAVKVFTAEVDRREIALLAGLSHPTILAYRAVVEDDGEVCLVTELAEGGDAAGRLGTGHEDLSTGLTDAGTVWYVPVVRMVTTRPDVKGRHRTGPREGPQEARQTMRGTTSRMAAEIGYRLGRCEERRQQPAAAMRAFREAAAATGGGEPFRLSALARLAALHETRREFTAAVAAYREIVTHSRDRELKAAAEGRLNQLASHTRR